MYHRPSQANLIGWILALLVFSIYGLSSSHAVAAPPLGVNGAVDWVDLTKTPRWAQYNSVPYTQDSAGWPSSDFTWVFLDDRHNMPWDGPDPNGKNNDVSGIYKLSFTGQAVFSNGNEDPGAVQVQNQVYNAGTNTTTADVVVNSGHWLAVINFANTKRLAGDAAGDGVTNLHLIKPGYPANTSQVFTNELLNAYGPSWGAIRMLGIDDTNSYGSWTGTNLIVTKWADRVKPNDAYQGGTPAENVDGHQSHGIAWEYMIMLCNQTNQDMWLNIPASVDDDYVTQLASLLKNGDTVGNVTYPGLNPNLHVYVEYSNEVWNFSFQQYVYNAVAAENEVAAGGSNLNNDGTTDKPTWHLRRYARRLIEISNLFKAVYGAPAINTTVRPVFLWAYDEEIQPSYFGPSVQSVLDWVNTNYGAPKTFYYGAGEAPYYGPSDVSSVDNIINTLWSGSDSERTRFIGWQAMSTYFGLKQVGYESGPGLNTGIEAVANRDPRMTATEVHHFLDNWFAVGGDLVNFFAMSVSGASAYGDWNTFDDWHNEHHPKMDGVIQILASTQPAITAGHVLPTQIGQSVSFEAAQVEATTTAPATSQTVTPDDFTSDYLLRSGGTGAYTVSLRGHQDNTNIQEQLYIDGAFLGNLSMITGSDATTTTVATSSLSAGQHTLRIHYVYLNGQTTGSAHAALINMIMTSGGGADMVPSAPENMRAASGNNSVTLAWATSTKATTYTIMRSTTSTSAGFTELLIRGGTSYTDTTAMNGTTYYYMVAGVDSAGQGGFSPVVSAMPVPGIPGVPGGLVIASNVGDFSPFGYSNGLVTLSWTQVPNATSYNIKRSTVSGSGYTTAKTQIDNHFSDVNLSAGTTYYYIVTASNALGESAASVEASTTPTMTIPQSPTALTAIPSDSRVSLQWTAPPFMAPGFAPQYSVKRGTNNGGPYTVISTPSTTSLIDASAVNGTTYYYVVTATKSAGESPLSNQVSATPTANGQVAVDCGGPTVGAFVNDSSFGGGLVGSSNTAVSTAAIDTSLVVNPAPQAVYQSDRVGTFTYTLVGLMPNGSYTVRLHFAETQPGITQPGQRQFNVLINGGQVLTNYDILKRATVNQAVIERIDTTSNGSGQLVVSFVNGPTGTAECSGIEIVGPPPTGPPPAAPTGLTATANGGSITLNWAASTGATSYNVYRGTAAGAEAVTPIATNIASSSYANTGLTNGVTYYYKVTAVNNIAESAMSNEASATINIPLPSVPTGLTATASGTTILLNWSASSGATSYNVYRGTAAGAEAVTPIATNITSTYYPNTGLTNGVTYYYKVTAVNVGGETAKSNEASATINIPLPSVPTGLTATASGTTITLNWSASTGATSYNVYRGTAVGAEAATPIVTNLTSTTYPNTGLTNGVTYYYKVTAVNTGGETAKSNEASATIKTSFDLNGDGKPDLVLQSATTNQIALWYMNGTTVTGGGYASLTPAAGFKVAGEADFNGDGKPDLVLQNTSTGQIAIWYMNGQTVVSGAILPSALPSGWSVVAVGDFNNDGKPDLVLQSNTANKIAIWYLNGTTLVTGQYLSASPAAGWHVVGAGDVNGDGKLDLFLQNTSTAQVAVWYLNGSTLTAGAYLSAIPTGYGVAGIGDFNGDGKPDVVLQNNTSNQIAYWYLNGTTVTSGAFVSLTPPSGFHVVAPK